LLSLSRSERQEIISISDRSVVSLLGELCGIARAIPV
jgi:hypothetical protein